MGRIKFLLIVSVFIIPFIFAQYFSISDVTDTRGTTNHGTFLTEEITITPQPQVKDKHWIILQVIPAICDERCKNNTYMLRQINTALGKDMGRVARYIIHKNQSSDISDFLNNYPKVVVLEDSENLYNKLVKMDGWIFIADPFGKIILGYKQDFIAKGFLKDLKKLLKYSKI
jgi:hypothetical protein